MAAKHNIHKNLKFLLLIFLILAVLISFLNNYLIPIKLKTVLQSVIENKLNKPVHFDKISFSAFKGLVIQNLTVWETFEKKETFLTAKNVSFFPIIIPVINKKIIITQLAADSLSFKTARDINGRFLLMEIIKPGLSKKNRGDFSVVITSINLKNSVIIFEDNFLPEPQTAIFENVTAKAYFSLPANVKLNFSSSLKDKAKEFSFKGAYYIPNKYLDLTINAVEINLHKFSPYFKDKVPLLLKNDTTTITAGLTVDSDKKLRVSWTGDINNTQIILKSLSLEGALAVKGAAVCGLKNKILNELSGSMTLKQNDLRGLPYVEKLKNITGTILFTKDGLFIENLTADTKGIPLIFEGHLKNLKQPELKLVIKSNLKLEHAVSQMPAQFSEMLKDFEIKGETLLNLTMEGKLKELRCFDFTGDAQLRDVIFKSAKPSWEIKNINSKIHFTKEIISIDKLNMDIKDKTYSLTADVSNFTQPLVDFKINSTDLFAAGKITVSKKTAQFEQILGKYKGINFEVSGQCANLPDPNLNIYAELTSNITSLTSIFPKTQKYMDGLQLNGKVSSSLYFDGKAYNPFNGFLKISASCPQLNLLNSKITNLNVNARIKENQLTIDNLSASCYDGKIEFSAAGKLENLKAPDFEAVLNISDINLNKFIKDTRLKNEKIKGTGSLQCSVKGLLNNTKTFKGSGWISVKDGYLWSIPLLDKLAGFLNIPELKDEAFKEAFGTYQIQNELISTENLTLQSDNINMTAKGNLGFNSSLNFIIETQFAEEFYESLKKKGGLTPLILETFAEYALTLNLIGTIQQPEFKLKTISLEKILKKELFKGLEKIFQ